MGIETILSRLQGLKAQGDNRWISRCPAHQDKTPSLTIRAAPDGRILMHCFAGCETEAVLGALGLEFGELFPEPLTREALPRVPQPFSALDALKCLTAESAIVAIASSDIVLGRRLSDRDAERVCTASGRIASALEVVHG